METEHADETTELYTNPLIARVNGDDRVGIFLGEDDDPESVTIWYGNIWDALIDGVTECPECWEQRPKSETYIMVNLIDAPTWMQYDAWVNWLNEEARSGAAAD